MSSKNEGLALRDPDVPPTDLAISMALGEAMPAYELFVEQIAAAGIEMNWRFYSDGTAWMAQGTRDKIGPRGGHTTVPAFWLSVWEGYFKAVVYFKATDRDAAAEAPVSDTVRQQIYEAPQMGKINQFPIEFDISEPDAVPTVVALAVHKLTMLGAL